MWLRNLNRLTIALSIGQPHNIIRIFNRVIKQRDEIFVRNLMGSDNKKHAQKLFEDFLWRVLMKIHHGKT
mgnify:CR=1 FL=1